MNDPFQGQGTGKLAPVGKYDRGSFGWKYDESTGLYMLTGHRDLIDVRDGLRPDEPAGFVNFVENDGSFTGIPNEPGHFASPKSHETKATFQIYGADLHALGHIATPESLDYEPLAA